MYLKALEIQGFKSFPDKTILSFGNEITAIVGPNGSGKSNISDAIRWVMGEQSSKALRGAKMEDVIFGGTLRRAQVGFAEVSLILDNQDQVLAVEAPEVMVTRRFYRSGDSEYYLNKHTARLKDIHELFMDTGLGREGYSNIGQGRIDEILSVKSAERREIFEEAAGISKYRHRKEDTQRRLDHTQENLLRIQDKIAELELQVEPLRVQAEKAKKFFIYRDALRGFEVTVWLDTLDRLAETIQNLNLEYHSSSTALQQEKLALEHIYQEAEALTEAIHACDVQAEQLRASISDTETQYRKTEAEIAVLQTNLTNNCTNIQRLKEELEARSQRSGGLEERIAQQQEQLDCIHAQLQNMEQCIKAAEEEAEQIAQNIQEVNTQLNLLRDNCSKTAGAEIELRAILHTAEQELQALWQRMENSQKEKATLEEQSAHTLAQVQQVHCALKTARESAEATGNIIAGYSIHLENRQRKKDALHEQLQALEMEMHTIDSRIKLYQEMEQGYEGYSKAVKMIMQEARRGHLAHIHGPVSQLLTTQDAYTIAMETALGNSMQSIVVDTEEAGKAAIQLLKRRDGGRATFLPISAIQGRVLHETGLEHCAGFVGLASNLVSFDEKYRGIFENLLGRTVIAEEIDDAIAIARRYHYHFRIVTLDGQVLNAGGSMTGGSNNRSSGMISRANELRRMTAQRKELDDRYGIQKQAFTQASRALEETQYNLLVAQDQLRAAEDEIIRLESETHHSEILLNTISQSLQSFSSDYQAMQQRIYAQQAHIKKLEQDMQEQKHSAEQQAALLSASSQTHATLSEAHNAASKHISQMYMDMAVKQAEETALQSNIAQLKQLIQELSGDDQRQSELMEQYHAENLQIQAQQEQYAQDCHLLEQQLANLRQGLKAQLENRTQLEANKIQKERKAQEQNKALLSLERRHAALEQKKATTALEEKQIIDRLWDNYELSRSAALDIRQAVESIPAAQKRIAELKRKISALGTPNIGAIEEFARVNERYEYLKAQKEDVEQSKEELGAIIRTLTAEMTSIFKAEFEKINAHFQQTFVEMFGGGKAALELEDPHDVLSCGIDIKVQPPGKQLKTLTLLSGGEKAFVAIALYFAILKVRPTPFCMLDEIDAALDDRNVARFARYLRSLSSATQFIVITHRRGTMEEADVLYGVTMQEQGVSKLLSMDLNQVAQELNIQ